MFPSGKQVVDVGSTVLVPSSYSSCFWQDRYFGERQLLGGRKLGNSHCQSGIDNPPPSRQHQRARGSTTREPVPA